MLYDQRSVVLESGRMAAFVRKGSAPGRAAGRYCLPALAKRVAGVGHEGP